MEKNLGQNFYDIKNYEKLLNLKFALIFPISGISPHQPRISPKWGYFFKSGNFDGYNEKPPMSKDISPACKSKVASHFEIKDDNYFENESCDINVDSNIFNNYF